MQEQLFVAGAPMGLQSDIQYALKVVGRPPVRPLRTPATTGARQTGGGRTVGFCTQVQTPQGNVMLAPFVPSHYPENWLNMLAYDRCSAPDEFPIRQTSPCDCGCGKPQCTGGCNCCQNQSSGATGDSPTYLGYYGEHHPREGEQILAAGYNSRPRCTSGRPSILRPVNPAPGTPPAPATVGACPSQFSAATPLPLQVVPGYPVPKRVVAMPRYAPVPAATSCGCDAQGSPEAAGAVTPPAAFYLYNPYGTINGPRPGQR